MFCKNCKKRKTCQKPCKEVEAYLKKFGIKSADWIRPQVSKETYQKDGLGRWREVPFSALPSDDRDKDPLFKDNR